MTEDVLVVLNAGSCHLPAVERVKAAHSSLAYNELAASQRVCSSNITHCGPPFQPTQNRGKAQIAKNKQTKKKDNSRLYKKTKENYLK